MATPGRLNDHLENSAGFARDTLGGLECLVFDEADQLLDMGFRPAIEQMLRAIQATRLTRQTLLFSATLPADVKGIAKLSMKDGSDYDFVDTVGDADEQTHSHVPQCCVVCEGKKLHSAELVARLADACGAPDHKVIVFFTTARLTQLYSELLVGLQGAQARGQAPDLAFLAKTRILEIHSRKSQSHRTKVADACPAEPRTGDSTSRRPRAFRARAFRKARPRFERDRCDPVCSPGSATPPAAAASSRPTCPRGAWTTRT